MGRSENERRCNTVELSLAVDPTEKPQLWPPCTTASVRIRFSLAVGLGEARPEGGNGEQQSEVARCGADTFENARADEQAPHSSSYLSASIGGVSVCNQEAWRATESPRPRSAGPMKSRLATLPHRHARDRLSPALSLLLAVHTLIVGYSPIQPSECPLR
jgi:hypothetical protein